MGRPCEVETLGAEHVDFERCREIRRQVFVDEQRVDPALEFDGLDEGSDHFLAWMGEGSDRVAVGTARLRPLGTSFEADASASPGKPTESAISPADRCVAKGERVAVLGEYRGQSIGRAIMKALEDRARFRGISRIVLYAQVAALPFYEDLGYRARGPIFIEAEIEHREMNKSLD